jgi:hypothetical protein
MILDDFSLILFTNDRQLNESYFCLYIFDCVFALFLCLLSINQLFNQSIWFHVNLDRSFEKREDKVVFDRSFE